MNTLTKNADDIAANPLQDHTSASAQMMIARLSISAWAGRKTNKRIGREADQQNNAKAGSVRATTSVIDKPDMITVNRAIDAARDEHKNLTLPWDDFGGRVLAAIGFAEYRDKMQMKREAVELAVANFVREYPHLRTAAADRLGKAFSLADFPDPSTISQKFQWSLQYQPIPTANDFRVNVSDSERDRIRDEIAESTTKVLENAALSAWNRVYKLVGEMVTKLDEYVPGIHAKKAGKRTAGREAVREIGGFRDSLVEHIQELSRILPTLNIARDPVMDSLATTLTEQLGQHDSDALKADDNLRAQTAERGREILQGIDKHLSVF